MSKPVDTRVVELEFNNKTFEENVKVSSSSLDKLKESLDLDGAAKGMSASSAIITGALLNLGAKAMEVGAQISKSLALDPIVQGLASYEKQIGSVQVIMNATGDTMANVEKVMGRLSWFADETSYSMDQMTGAASRFVSNNIPLEKSATAIQGIATMAALAGVNGQNAAIAFNNISDAIAKGGLSAIDYKSLELAGITTTEFKKTAIDAAIAMGTLGESGEILNGKLKGTLVTVNNFKETLSDQASGMWFTNDVILSQADAFGKYATEVNRVMVEVEGIGTVSEAVVYITETLGAEWEALGKKAFLAAQESKTLTDSINYTKDALASGWANTWKLVFGNYEEARIVFTALSDLLYRVVVSAGDARNEMLTLWKKEDGRQAFLESLDYLVHIIGRLTAPIREAFAEIFPPITGKRLAEITKQVRDTLAGFKMTVETTENLKKTFAGLFATVDIGIHFFKTLITFAGNLVKLFAPATSSLLSLSGGFGDFMVKIRDSVKNGKVFETFFNTLLAGIIKMKEILSPITTALGNGLKDLGFNLSAAGDVIKNIFSGDGGVGSFGARIGKALEIVFGHVNTFMSSFDGLFSKVGAKIKEFAKVDIDAGFFETLNGVLNNLPTLEAIVLQIQNFFNEVGNTLNTFSPAFKKVWDVAGPILNDFLTSIKNTLGDLNLEKTLQILNSILSIGLVKTMMNLTGAFAQFSAGSTKVMASLTGVFDKLGKSISAFSFGVSAKAIRDIAIAIAILVAALIAMSFIEIEKLAFSLGVLTVVIAELLGAFYILKQMKDLNSKDLIKLSVVFVALGASILLLSSAMQKVADLSWEELAKGLVTVAALMFGLTLAAKSLGKSKEINAIGPSLLVLSVALFALVQVVKLYSALDIDMVVEGLGTLGLVLVALALSLKSFSSTANLPSIAAGLLLLGVALGSLASMIFLYSKFSFGTLVKGLLSMAATIIVFGVATRTFSASMKSAGAFAIMAGALVALAFPLVILSKLSMTDIVKGLIGVAGACVVLVLSAKSLTKDTTANLAALGASLLAFAGGLRVLAAAMKTMDNETLVKSLLAVTTAALLMIAVDKAGTKAKGALVASVAMLVVMSGLAAIFHLLATFSDVEALEAVAKSLTLVMFAMAGMLVAMGSIDAAKAMKAQGSVLALELLLIPLGLILIGLAKWTTNPDNLIPIATSMGILMDALAVAVAVLSTNKMDPKSLLMGSAALAILAVIAAGVGLVLVKLSQMENIGPVITIAIAIGILITALSGAMVILGLAGPLAQVAMAALIPLVAVIGVTLSLVMILGALAKYQAQAEAGVAMLGIIGKGIGDFIGGIIAGAMSTISGVLPKMGQDLTDFMTNIQGFIDGVRQIDGAFLESVLILSAALLAITATDLISGLANLFGGQFNSQDLGDKLAGLGEGLAAFYNAAKTIDKPLAVQAYAEAVLALMKALEKVPMTGGILDSIFSGIAGTKSTEALQTQLKVLASALTNFYDATTTVVPERVERLAKTMVVLFESLSKAPNSGGFIEELTGGNGGDKVGRQLAAFGTYMKIFYDETADIIPDDLDRMSASVTTLFKALKEAPNDKGVISWFTGNNNVSKIGQDLTVFGAGVASFASSTRSTDTDQLISVSESIVPLFTALKDAPNSGGLVSLFTGNNDVGKIGLSLASFGGSLATFSTNVENVDPITVAAFGNAMTTLFSSFKEINAVASGGYHSVGNFATQLVTIGKKCAEFAGIMTDDVINTIVGSTGAIDTIKGMLAALAEVDVYGQAAFFIGSLTSAIGDSLTNEASKEKLIIKMEELLEAMLSAFWSPTTDANIVAAVDMMFFPERFAPIGQKVVEGIGIGMRDTTELGAVSDTLADSIVKALDLMFPDRTVPIGKDVGQGFIVGTRSKFAEVFKTGQELGQAMDDGLRDITKVHSIPPEGEGSRGVGEDTGEGFIVGIKSKLQGTFNAGAEQATALIDGLGTGLVDGDMIPVNNEFSKKIDEMVQSANEQAGDGGEEIGKELVTSTGTGIKKEKSAEERAKEKAQAIVDSFAKGLSEITKVIDRFTLEFNIFEKSLGFLSSDDTYAYASREATVNTEKLRMLSNQLLEQQKKIGVAQEKYNKMLAEFGADSEYTSDAADELRQEQYKVLEYQYQIDELRYNTTKSREDIYKQGAESEAEYRKLLADTLKEYQSMGYTNFKLVDLQKKLAEEVGYDPEWKTKLEGTLTKSAIDTGAVVADTYQREVMTNMGSLTGDYTQMGVNYSNALGQGAISGAGAVVQSMSTVSSMGLAQATSAIAEWYTAGADSIKSFVQGMLDHMEEAISAATVIAEAAVSAAIKVLLGGGGIAGAGGGGIAGAGGGFGGLQVVAETLETTAQTFDHLTGEARAYAEAMARGIGTEEWLEILNSGDYEVFLTPVLDMTELKKNPNIMIPLAPTASTQQARSVSSTKTSAENQNGSGTNINNYNFTQNNTSPKALSRTDIYRQTNNQFSTLKEVVKAP